MAQTGVVSRNGEGVARGSSGLNTGDGTVLTVNLGFRPKKVEILNQTDITLWTKIDGMVDANTLKTVAAGTMTIDTASAIVITNTGFTYSATANVTGKVTNWYAE